MFLAVLLVPIGWSAERAHVTILATTDVHAHLNPIDYYTNQPDQTGLAKAATIIAAARRQNPDLLLLDSGDTIQGTPLAYYHNRKNNQPPDPTVLAMNALRYDAMTVGNHEYNHGLKVLEKARGEATFPWLSANTYRVGTDQTAYQPYLVKLVGGVRVGILGLTTPGVPYWDNPENYAGLEFREPVAEAKKWVHLLHAREKVDLVVIAMHMGLEEDLRTGIPTPNLIPSENTALAIARQVPGIDVILMGHTHREVPALFANGVLLTQADKWADRVARVDVYLEKSGDAGWRVDAKSALTIPVTEKIAPDPVIVKLAEPYDRETQAWLGKTIGESSRELTADDARVRDTAILDLIQRVQLDAGRADVSMASSLNLGARLPKGPVTVRDMAGLYVYENTLVVIEATGAVVKAALEHSAKYFRPYEPGKSPAELFDERIPAYNFDVAEGVSYDLDLARPV
ncbi:MAG: hypothetical protein A3G75_14935, partial [Verrucomicrobia bacterium RIFCSPLOWO2_12_FULL_64_8]